MKYVSQVCSTVCIAISISACSDTNDSSVVSVDELDAGAYVVSSGNTDSLLVGKYYSDTQGNRVLILNGDDEKAETLYQQSSNGDWAVVSNAESDTTIELSQSTEVVTTPINLDTLVGSYVTRVKGQIAEFEIGDDGLITAGDTDCQLSGELTESSLPGAALATLKLLSCGAELEQLTGWLLNDQDYLPAKFRLVVTSDSSVIDLLAFSE